MFRKKYRKTLGLFLIVALLALATTIVMAAQAPGISHVSTFTGGGQSHQAGAMQVTTIIGQPLSGSQTNNGFTLRSGIGGIIGGIEPTSPEMNNQVFLPLVNRQ